MADLGVEEEIRVRYESKDAHDTGLFVRKRLSFEHKVGAALVSRV